MTRKYETASIAIAGQSEHDLALQRLADAVNTLRDTLVSDRGDTVRFEHVSHAVAVSGSMEGPRFSVSALVHFSYDRPAGRMTLAELRATAAPGPPTTSAPTAQ